MWSHRMPRWEHWLLNRFDEPLALLDGVEGGSVTLQGLTRLGGHGSMVIDDRGLAIDWGAHRVRHIYDPGIAGVEPWPVATHMLSSPVEGYSATGVQYTVDTLPKTQIVDEDAFDTEYSLPAGANIINAVVAVLESTGETRISVTPSDAVLANPQSFDAGESKLTIVNDLLQAAGYWSLFADGSGQLQVAPYQSPADRAFSYRFQQGEASVHLPEWERSQDSSSVPNKVIVRGVGSDDEPPLFGVATLDDPDSPFSFQARGRWVTRVDDGFEGADQAAFNQRAETMLLGALAPLEHVSVTHAIVPVVPNDVVLFEDSGYLGRLQVVNMEIPFDLEGDVRAEWRRTGD